MVNPFSKEKKMLGKGKNEIIEEKPIPSPVPVEKKTIIGRHISIEGNIVGKEDLMIEGTVKGSVELEEHHLIVGPEGKVDGEVHAQDVTISGQLTGNINALGMVMITKEANFDGEIKAKSLSVEDGAYLKAAIELESKKKAVPIDKAMDQGASKIAKEPVSIVSEDKARE